jgi:hypothetical protein
VTVDATFREAAADWRIEGVPLSHLSIELGHLYVEDFAAGPDALRRHFERVAPWARTAATTCAEDVPAGRARISTCFLIDDYFTRFSSPAEVVPSLIETARSAGLEIDYLARESGCAEANGIPVARLVEERIVAEPTPNTNGSRPPTTETGWLSNGQRSPWAEPTEAMGAVPTWAPPIENAANRHSIFVDVELWSDADGKRTWSCPFLAAVWQMLRLGMLRHLGEAVATPQPSPGDFPSDWDGLPAIIKLNPKAAPFSAYRTLSVLAARFLPIEHAVRTILSQVAVENEVAAQILARSRQEKLSLAGELVDRIDYVFVTA